MNLGYLRNNMVLGVERSKVRVTGSISGIFTLTVAA